MSQVVIKTQKNDLEKETKYKISPLLVDNSAYRILESVQLTSQNHNHVESKT